MSTSSFNAELELELLQMLKCTLVLKKYYEFING